MEASPLKKLPAELRNHIYELVFMPERSTHEFYDPKIHPIDIFFRLDPDGQLHPSTASSDRHAAALTATCREVRNDTIAMFYSVSHFKLHLERSPTGYKHNPRFEKNFVEAGKQVTLFRRWLDIIGAANTEHLKYVCLQFSGCDDACDLPAGWSSLRTLIGATGVPAESVHVEFDYFSPSMGRPYVICHQVPLWDTEAARRKVDREVAQMRKRMETYISVPATPEGLQKLADWRSCLLAVVANTIDI